MNKITCDVCMDLMPLVRDGVASDDSRRAVEQHIGSCAACKALCGKGMPPAINTEKAFHKFKRRLWFFSVLLMMFGMFFGLGLTAGADMFYNSLIMPVIGVLGYVIFRWKALYEIPVLLLLTHGLLNLFRFVQKVECLDAYSLLMWTALYGIFALLGTGIAGLLHYVFNKGRLKENQQKSGLSKRLPKAAALLAAVLLVFGLCMFANALVGNPVSKLLAKKTAKAYLAEHYAATDFIIERISYSFKDGNYYAHVTSPGSDDSYFTLSFDFGGHLLWDSYANMVESGENTMRRLNRAYRELTDSVFESSAFLFTSEIAFGDLELSEKPEADRLYNIPELGAKAGHLTVYVEDKEVSIERAAEILLEIRRLMNEGGAPFYSIDFVLQYPRAEEGGRRPEGQVEVRNFLCADIYESGMSERVKAANEAVIAYYMELDAEK